MFSEKVMSDARRLLLDETPIQRLHRELAEYRHERDEAWKNLTLALVDVAKEVNRELDIPNPDDWFAA